MPNYGVKFNHSGKVTFPEWTSGTAPFTVKIHFKTGDLSNTGGLLSDDSVAEFLAIYQNGKYAIKIGGGGGGVWVSSDVGVLSANTVYFLEIGRTDGTNSYVSLRESDDVTVVDSHTLTSAGILTVDTIGRMGTSFAYNGEIYEVSLTGSVSQDRQYLSSVNTGTVWSEVLNNQDGTLVGLSDDGTEWVLAPSLIPVNNPIEFNGTIPNFEYYQGQVVNEDLSSYFSGTETPFISSNIGNSLTTTGLSLNTDFTLSGTALEGSATGVIIRGTDDTPDTADSNPFNVVVSSLGKTRSEIEAADTTGGLNPPFLLNDFDENDLQTDVFTFSIDTLPSAGSLETTPFSTFKFSGAPDGIYTFTYTGYKNGVSYGSATVTLDVGGSILNMVGTNAPDGTYSSDIYNNDTKTLIETRDIAFSGGDASEAIPLDVGSEVLVFIEGDNPPVTGLAYIGVTE
jgi:hypothetical protein